MNLSQLRYVVEVEKTGSITKAAKQLYMGQPNLSKAIRELESEVGITIFRRTAQGVEPTPIGAQFLSYAKTILSQVDELESFYKPQWEKEFRFDVSVPRATYISVAFTDFLQDVPKEVPLAVHFKETSSMGAITDVANGCLLYTSVKQAMQPLFTTAPEEERAGLGFAVMESFMDKLKVSSRPERGTTVVMTKRIRSREQNG